MKLNIPLVSLLFASACLAQDPSPQSVNPANQQFQNPPPEAATMVTIGWTISSSSNIISQTVSWGLQTTNYTLHMNLAPTVTKFQLIGLQPATTYHIAVLCTQATGTYGTNLVKSYYGNEIVWTTTPTTRPVSPSNAAVISSP